MKVKVKQKNHRHIGMAPNLCRVAMMGTFKRRDFDRPNTFAVRLSLVQFGSLWSHARSKSRSVHCGSICMASVGIINFENKLRLGHVKVSSGNGYAFGLELGKRILPVCDRHRGTDVTACITTVNSSLKHYYIQISANISLALTQKCTYNRSIKQL